MDNFTRGRAVRVEREWALGFLTAVGRRRSTEGVQREATCKSSSATLAIGDRMTLVSSVTPSYTLLRLPFAVCLDQPRRV